MDELELSKYMNWMLREYGPEWKDVLNDQLRTNQFGDNLPSNMGLLNSRADIDQVLGSKLIDNPEYPHITMTPTHESMMSIDGVPRGSQLLNEDPSLGFPSAFHAAEGEVPLGEAWGTSSSLPLGSGGYASLDAAAGMPYVEPQVAQRLADSSSLLGPSSPPPLALSTNQAIAQAYPLDYTASGANISATAAETAAALEAAEAGATATETGSSAWGGPAVFAGNMALNMIPTRDRRKVDTPLGDRGSMSGIVKGGGKGALTGATIGSLFPGPGTAIGAAIGGGLGVIGGAQGYFDSTSPPSIQISRIIRGRGMPQGLLGGGTMYG